ncbi:probable ubiquitin-conjugating enzyme E2 24 [Malania oleifera]|uniref:probable ubiquitin-conjugating enzyme E2 24 n=1 Tax=Malania oleifera TaxID=397392 RepID=UPI0025AE9265|nr:probable ubiquitin-conjugating enzyme E2 24 [Malania oleifera]
MEMLLNDSGWESFSESGISDDQEEIDSVYSGTAQSILSSLEESIGKIDDFLSFDRGFVHGDVVCSVSTPDGQMGKVVHVDMFVDLENVHGRIIRDVHSKKLLKVRSITVGDYVAHGPWLGMVNKVIDRVTILFDDWTKCEVLAVDREKLLPISTNLLEDSRFPYYPGQRVLVEVATISKSATRLCGTWKGNRDEGTVCAVEAAFVYVNWLASALGACKPSSPPPCLQESKQLTLLSHFSHELWQLGDWCICPDAGRKRSLEQHFLKGYRKCEREITGRDPTMDFDEIFVISKTKTKVDVLWQDGSCSLGLESKSLCPVNIVNVHEFWPGQFVLEKTAYDDPAISSSQRWGVVGGMDSKERTVRVVWKGFSANQANDKEGDLMEEIVSAYELVEHPDYTYCLGDIVFRLEKNQFLDQPDGQACKCDIITERSMGNMVALRAHNCGRDLNEYCDKCYLSSIGCVTGIKDGDVEVTWATGQTTKVEPYEIFRVDEGSSTNPAHYEENVEEFDEERIEHGQKSLHQNEKDLLEFSAAHDGCKWYPWDFSSFSLPQAAIGFFTSIAANLFGVVGSTSVSSSMLPIKNSGGSEFGIPNEKVLESHNHCIEEQSLAMDDFPGDIHDGKVYPCSSSGEVPEQFRQFDMVSDFSDHHFVDGANKGLVLPQVKRSWLKKVQQEWSILGKDLPETIYVRICEERMDLLRAAIVGAQGTPYHDGLFFFDIFLPPEYPYEPPLVHYNSGGLRLNPNLYESGKVCLSLLNTWTGTDTEVWNPRNSTILQVLLSLQALVLNEKPYFNEAGYEKQMGRAEGERNSVSYNEDAFLVTCKSMLYVLHKPPKHFERLVEEHFRRRSQHIILACKAYMEGAAVGCASGQGKMEQPGSRRGSSMGFKIMLAKLLPRLVEAFSEKGIDCRQYI